MDKNKNILIVDDFSTMRCIKPFTAATLKDKIEKIFKQAEASKAFNLIGD